MLGATANNYFYSTIPVLVGIAFDTVRTPGWEMTAILALALQIGLFALGQGTTGLARNYCAGILAQRLERDSRDEFYVSLLGKSQTFHGRQRIGDIMARATNDVHMVNLMFSPGLNLIVDSALGDRSCPSS